MIQNKMNIKKTHLLFLVCFYTHAEDWHVKLHGQSGVYGHCLRDSVFSLFYYWYDNNLLDKHNKFTVDFSVNHNKLFSLLTQDQVLVDPENGYNYPIISLNANLIRLDNASSWGKCVPFFVEHAKKQMSLKKGSSRDMPMVTLIDRQDAWDRTIYNLDELLMCLNCHAEKNKYEIKYIPALSKLSLFEQLKLVIDSDLIIYVFGSNGENNVFLEPHASVIQIIPPVKYVGEYYVELQRQWILRRSAQTTGNFFQLFVSEANVYMLDSTWVRLNVEFDHLEPLINQVLKNIGHAN